MQITFCKLCCMVKSGGDFFDHEQLLLWSFFLHGLRSQVFL